MTDTMELGNLKNELVKLGAEYFENVVLENRREMGYFGYVTLAPDDNNISKTCHAQIRYDDTRFNRKPYLYCHATQNMLGDDRSTIHSWSWCPGTTGTICLTFNGSVNRLLFTPYIRPIL